VPILHQLRAYIRHKLFEINEYSLHSPFLYNLYIHCFRNPGKLKGNVEIELLRKKLIQNQSRIPIIDLGAGSTISAASSRTISSIAKKGITKARYSKLFQSIIHYLDYKEILELGTSFGLHSMYMSKAHYKTHVTTIEGCSSIAEVARDNFRAGESTNINLIIGNIDQKLPEFLESSKKIDFVFIDANHTYKATQRYYKQLLPHLSEKAMVVIDDIYWSAEMTKAWNWIVNDSSGIIKIDIFQCGIVLFDNQLPNGHYRFAY